MKVFLKNLLKVKTLFLNTEVAYEMGFKTDNL